MVTDENGFIGSGQKNVMRHQMENKALLEEKGSIYVGTGETTAKGYYKTAAFEKGEESSFLITDMDKSYGLSWGEELEQTLSVEQVEMEEGTFAKLRVSDNSTGTGKNGELNLYFGEEDSNNG